MFMIFIKLSFGIAGHSQILECNQDLVKHTFIKTKTIQPPCIHVCTFENCTATEQTTTEDDHRLLLVLALSSAL